MLDLMLQKLLPVVLRLIQSDHMRNSEMFEHLNVVLRLISSRLFLIVNWPHECYELARYDPIQVSILDFLIVFVLLWVESLELVPSVFNGKLQSFKTVVYLYYEHEYDE